ncbi:hypothetical protein UZ36_02045 [Candidatus Nitromaritima sp. SCGC AAA799-C22]|nr:hypothetical protein UZ36_02045 [Candidatus Nitromaritima sp. SCGC AAA799-C22]
MFVFDPINQGLEFLARRDLEKAESMFLRIINDPYAQHSELSDARTYLNDIRACQSGSTMLDFDRYKKLTKKTSLSLEAIDELLGEIYFSPMQSYRQFDEALTERIPDVINRLKQLKVRDIVARDNLFEKMETNGVRWVKQELANKNGGSGGDKSDFEVYRWKTIFRKFIEQINPLLLERHLELLDYILQTGEIQLLDDPKLTTLTPKYRWIIESTLRSKWFLLRSYFFKAKSEIESQFNKKEGTRKYWEEIKYKKIKIFEECQFTEQNIQKFLFIDKLNYHTLEEIHEYAKNLKLTLIPRDVSLALRGVNKARDHIKERAGILIGQRREFQDQLRGLGFSDKSSYEIARQAKRSNSHQISEAYQLALKVASDEISWYRILPQSKSLRRDIESQCCKHLSTVRIHMFERGRLNKILLQGGKSLIRKYLIDVYGENVVGLHCYFRLETIHQYYKLKFFQYHDRHVPSVSELIKISRKDFQPRVVDGYHAFVKKRRLNIPPSLYEEMENHRSLTSWEDQHTTPEEKLLLKFWFLMDHGINITQGLVQKGVFSPGGDLWSLVKNQGSECNS